MKNRRFLGKILFDVNHPAHVHLFKNTINELIGKGCSVMICARDKDVTLKLLDSYGFVYEVCSKQKKGLKALGELLIRIINIVKVARRFKPDCLVSVGSPAAAMATVFLGRKHVVFEDTEHSREQYCLYAPFTRFICTPSCFMRKLGKKQITYNGYHELAYLHPDRFKPNDDIYDLLGVGKDEKYIIIRLISWSATHDIGQAGLSLALKRSIIDTISSKAKIFIVSEKIVSEEFKPYVFSIPPDRIHDALYFSSMYIGEGGTMATEAAILGTPSIFVNSLTAGVFKELEGVYKLMFSFSPHESGKILRKIDELLSFEDSKQEWQKNRLTMLAEKIDVCAWMTNFIEGQLIA